MEDIKSKAKVDELNIEKGQDIHTAPKKFIPVPKVKENKRQKK